MAGCSPQVPASRNPAHGSLRRKVKAVKLQCTLVQILEISSVEKMPGILIKNTLDSDPGSLEKVAGFCSPGDGCCAIRGPVMELNCRGDLVIRIIGGDTVEHFQWNGKILCELFIVGELIHLA